jgi:hypothetical protein
MRTVSIFGSSAARPCDMRQWLEERRRLGDHGGGADAAPWCGGRLDLVGHPHLSFG